MKRDSFIYALSGTLFGLIVGWILGSQQTPAPVVPAQASSQSASSVPVSDQQPPPLNEQRVAELRKVADAQSSNAEVRAELGNTYFDAGRYDEAIPWYEAAFRLNPKNADLSTDLGVCYYQLSQFDKALAQFDKSLAIDPKHVKTLLNQGIVRAFGKSDLKGAEESWQRVVDIAPNSEEGARAKQGIEGLKSGHGTAGGGRGSGSS
jgi:tetratricopeptide (TPR) repeat protein